MRVNGFVFWTLALGVNITIATSHYEMRDLLNIWTRVNMVVSLAKRSSSTLPSSPTGIPMTTEVGGLPPTVGDRSRAEMPSSQS